MQPVNQRPVTPSPSLAKPGASNAIAELSHVSSIEVSSAEAIHQQAKRPKIATAKDMQSFRKSEYLRAAKVMIRGVHYESALEAHESALQPQSLSEIFADLKQRDDNDPMNPAFWEKSFELMDEKYALYNNLNDEQVAYLNRANAVIQFKEAMKQFELSLAASFGATNTHAEPQLLEAMRNRFDEDSDFSNYILGFLPPDQECLILLKELLGRTAKLYACLDHLQSKGGYDSIIATVSSLFPYKSSENDYACLSGTILRLETAENTLRYSIEPKADFTQQIKNSIHHSIEAIKNAFAIGLLQKVDRGNQIHIPAMLDHLMGVSTQVLNKKDQWFRIPLWSTPTENALEFMNRIKAATFIDSAPLHTSEHTNENTPLTLITPEDLQQFQTLVSDFFQLLYECETKSDINAFTIEAHPFIGFLKSIDPGFNLFEDKGAHDQNYPILFDEACMPHSFDVDKLKDRINESLKAFFRLDQANGKSAQPNTAQPNTAQPQYNLDDSCKNYCDYVAHLKKVCEQINNSTLDQTDQTSLLEAEDSIEHLYFLSENFLDSQALLALKIIHDLGVSTQTNPANDKTSDEHLAQGLAQLNQMIDQMNDHQHHPAITHRLEKILHNLIQAKTTEKFQKPFEFLAQVDMKNLKASVASIHVTQEYFLTLMGFDLNKPCTDIPSIDIPLYMGIAFMLKLSTFEGYENILIDHAMEAAANYENKAQQFILECLFKEQLLDLKQASQSEDFYFQNIGTALLYESFRNDLTKTNEDFSMLLDLLLAKGYTDYTIEDLATNTVQYRTNDRNESLKNSSLLDMLIENNNFSHLQLLFEKGLKSDTYVRAIRMVGHQNHPNRLEI